MVIGAVINYIYSARTVPSSGAFSNKTFCQRALHVGELNKNKKKPSYITTSDW